MNSGLFGIGSMIAFIGLILLVLRMGGKVKVKIPFGDYQGDLGSVLIIFGFVLMALSYTY